MTTGPTLLEVLDEARARGFVGPGPIEAHVDVARTGESLLAAGMRAVDLGSGGGALGLPLAVLVPGVAWVLVESSQTRADFLRRAVGRLDLVEVEVIASPAEVAGRDDRLRGGFDAVFARSFGPPATTAECSAPFLRVGGMLAVTEPPDGVRDELGDPARWPTVPLATLGLALGPRVGAFQTLLQQQRCSDRFPRRTGVPRRQPLF